MSFFDRKIFYSIASEMKSLSGDCLYINGFIFSDGKQIQKNNLGDDLNVPLLEFLTNKPVKILGNLIYKKREHLLCIGSIIENYCNSHSIIWGSGAIEGEKKLKSLPKKVCAVRGPRTRKYLIDQGVACPEIYGDPALLMPCIYMPKQEKKYDLGLIPHYIDNNLPQLEEIRRKHPEILIVNLSGYKSWQTVIDQICQCRTIVSSSLHGMILADAYKIPNCQIQLSDMIVGGNYKFIDYFEGVKRKYVAPINGLNGIDLLCVKKELSSYNAINFPRKKLLDAFPYPLSPNLKGK
ncbi:polysaccharide pyruvyl transferase family protein [Candidatus Saccharibacteria bacterium]|nr:polysaccharide pyruvyl transferase family protein [Candidatus Saccharibacteria bacterium]